jgi:hypothetical protein
LFTHLIDLVNNLRLSLYRPAYVKVFRPAMILFF